MYPGEMAPTIREGEPTTLTVGTSWDWDKSFGDFPASDGWELSYRFRGPDDLDVDWGSGIAADGDGFQVRIAPATTDISAGAYRLIAVVTDGADTYTPVDVRVNVLANPAASVASASTAKQMLDAIDAALLANPGGEHLRVTINGRTVEYRRNELLTERATWNLQYQLERNSGARLQHAGRFVG